MTTRPTVAPATEALYDGLGPALRQGDDQRWVLLSLLDAPGQRLDEVDAVLRDRPGSPGWAIAADLDRTPFLPWLMQWVGVVHRPELTPAGNRDRARRRPESKRGTVGYIRAVAREHLTGDKRVEVYERWEGDARAVRVRVFASEVDGPDRLEVALLDATPWTIKLTFEVAVGWSLQQLHDAHATLQDIADEFDTLTDIAYHEP